jgi:hypothetical protein
MKNHERYPESLLTLKYDVFFFGVPFQSPLQLKLFNRYNPLILPPSSSSQLLPKSCHTSSLLPRPLLYRIVNKLARMMC